jgi:hypothetical protein
VAKGQFILQPDYTIENGMWKVHFVNPDPGGDQPSEYFAFCTFAEIPENLNQQQLRTLLTTRLAGAYNNGCTPLNTAIANGMTITLT